MKHASFNETNRVRAVVLYAIGALTGLGLAGYGLFTAQGTTTRKVAPENVAVVNDRPILRSDFINQLENETGAQFGAASRAQQLKVIDEMVREELLVQRGLELDFAQTDQDTRNALVASMSQLAVAQVTLAGVPDEALLRKFYSEHREQYATPGAMTIRNFYLPAAAGSGRAPELLDEIAAALRTGHKDVVVRRYGLKTARGAEDDWYWVAKLHLGDDVFAHVRGLGAGQVYGPWSSADGIHFARMEKNVAPDPLSFEQSRNQVAGDYAKAAQGRLTEDTLTFLRNRARILVAEDYPDYRP
jgi:hypothetical protein